MPRLARPFALLPAGAAAIALLCGARRAGRVPAGAAASDRAPAVHVFAPPTAVPGTDGRRHLVYEAARERSGRPVRERLDVRDPDRGRPRELPGGRWRTWSCAWTAGRTRVIPGTIGCCCWMSPSGGAADPGQARQPPRSRDAGAAGRRDDRRDAGAATPALRVAPPLHGGNLGVLGCCGRPFAHRLAVTTRAPRSDRPVFAQRYAIDFVRLGDGLATFSGDPKRNES